MIPLIRNRSSVERIHIIASGLNDPQKPGSLESQISCFCGNFGVVSGSTYKTIRKRVGTHCGPRDQVVSCHIEFYRQKQFPLFAHERWPWESPVFHDAFLLSSVSQGHCRGACVPGTSVDARKWSGKTVRRIEG